MSSGWKLYTAGKMETDWNRTSERFCQSFNLSINLYFFPIRFIHFFV